MGDEAEENAPGIALPVFGAPPVLSFKWVQQAVVLMIARTSFPLRSADPHAWNILAGIALGPFDRDGLNKFDAA